MNAKAFFDTNVLIYAVSRDDPRQNRALDLLSIGGLVSVQVLNEFVSVTRRKLRRPWEDVKESLAWIRLLCPNPIPLTQDVHETAVKIAERYGFHIYDAVVVASALEAGCDVLYSEDLQDGQLIAGSLTVRNPFA